MEYICSIYTYVIWLTVCINVGDISFDGFWHKYELEFRACQVCCTRSLSGRVVAQNEPEIDRGLDWQPRRRLTTTWQVTKHTHTSTGPGLGTETATETEPRLCGLFTIYANPCAIICCIFILFSFFVFVLLPALAEEISVQRVFKLYLFFCIFLYFLADWARVAHFQAGFE